MLVYFDADVLVYYAVAPLVYYDVAPLVYYDVAPLELLCNGKSFFLLCYRSSGLL
jgi:hypothetical protein